MSQKDAVENHPLFTTDYINSEAMQGIQALQEETKPERRAEIFKNSGNRAFKLKRYDDAITYYTKAIDINCFNEKLNSTIYSNRGYIHYLKGSYCRAIGDSTIAFRKNKKNYKAYYRCANAFKKIGSYENAIQVCKSGIENNYPNKELNNLLIEIKSLLKTEKQREENTNTYEKRKKEILKIEILKRKLNYIEKDKENFINLSFKNIQPYFNSIKNILHWPVIFIYEEYKMTDYIEDFGENESFYDHLSIMFPPKGDRPSWDVNGQYMLENLEIYYKNEEINKFKLIDVEEKLAPSLCKSGYYIYKIPVFYVICKGNKFSKYFVDN